jgi:hypothetical protein
VPPSSGELTLHPSSSSTNRPPHLPRHARAAGPHRCRRGLSERRCPRRNTAAPPHPPPHRRPTPLVTSPHCPHAHAADRTTREPPASPGRPRHRAVAPVATGRCTHGSHAHRAAWHGPAGPLCHWARPTVLGLGLESQPNTVRQFSDFQFLFIILENSYKLQKCIENTILLRKIQDKFLYTP